MSPQDEHGPALYDRVKAEWLGVRDGPGRDQFDSAVETLLLSDRLLVLAGLGASLYVREADGSVVAPTMGGLWDAVEEAAPEQLANAIIAVGVDKDARNIEHLLSRCQAALELKDDSDLRSFVSQAEESIVAACDFLESVEQVPVHESFLRKLARRPDTVHRFQVFTTNYDLAFEYGASAAGLVSIDGFTQAEPRRFDVGVFDQDIIRRRPSGVGDIQYVPGVHYLYKLHGSIGWVRDGPEVLLDGTRRREAGDASATRCLIYPRDSKFQLSYEPPFFDLMASFQGALRQDNVGVIVIGSGFGDQHIARPIISAIRTNPSLSAMFVDPALRGDPEPLQPIRRLVGDGDPRLHLVASKFEEFVPLLPELQPATDAELQAKRVDAAGFP
jgi:hypothetical protein